MSMLNPTSTPNPRAQGTPPIFIPQFYFPGTGPGAAHKASADKVDAFFAVYPQGLSLDNLKALLKQVFGLPTPLAYPLFYKMAPGEEGLVSRAALRAWLDRAGFWGLDGPGRAMEILRAPGSAGVTPADLKPVLAGILISHPGLEFLAESPEFQERWVGVLFFFWGGDACMLGEWLGRGGCGGRQQSEFPRLCWCSACAGAQGEGEVESVVRASAWTHHLRGPALCPAASAWVHLPLVGFGA